VTFEWTPPPVTFEPVKYELRIESPVGEEPSRHPASNVYTSRFIPYVEPGAPLTEYEWWVVMTSPFAHKPTVVSERYKLYIEQN
jgi:hypothetical protein